MKTLAILFGPALALALVLGLVAYVGSDAGGVWGKSFPALVAFVVAFGAVFLADAAFLLIGWALRRFLAIAVVVALAVATLTPAIAGDGLLPDPVLTPGVARPLSIWQVCNTKWGRDARAVTAAMKRQVFASYGIMPARQHLATGKAAYEIDHLVSRELAGADVVANLWPQPYTGSCTAHDKDRLENRLHQEVCAVKTAAALAAVQAEIRRSWIMAYEKRFGSCRR